MCKTRLKFFLFLWIGTGSPENVKKSDFVELKFICDSDQPKFTSMQGLKIIGISAGTASNTQKMSVHLVINLWNCKFNVQTKIFTIGTENVANTDINTKNGCVAYRNEFFGNIPTLNTFLNRGNKDVHAIAILYKKDYTFPEFVLNSKNPTLNIDDKMKDLIKTHLVDMIVYSRKAPYEQCEIFTNLYEEYSKEPYILREFDNAQKCIHTRQI